MQVLIDTFPFIWLVSEPSQLSITAKEVLSDQENEFFMSDASVLEICLKYNDGTIEMPMSPRSWVKINRRFGISNQLV